MKNFTANDSAATCGLPFMNANNSRKRRYLHRKLHRLCVDCEAGLPEDADSVRCVECKERQLGSQTRYLKTDKGREAFNTRLVTKRATWRASGLCTRCGGARDRDGKLCTVCLHKLKCIRHGVLLTVRMPTIRARGAGREIATYQPLDELEQGYRVRLLRALWWRDWSNTHELFDVCGVDASGESTDRNNAQVMLGRLVKMGLVEKRLLGRQTKLADYRITDAGRAEVARYRTGDLKTRKRAA